jgi:catechol 2,3-dioxygenase-like lactoylglutathione lyase family enzyme
VTSSNQRPQTRFVSTVLGASDPQALAEFYSRLMGWPIVTNEPDWVTVRPTDGSTGLSFQLEETHVAPTWPQVEGKQQMQLHLDIQVDDLAEAVAFAESIGARQAAFQPQEHVRVLLDPAGHPFCLFDAQG